MQVTESYLLLIYCKLRREERERGRRGNSPSGKKGNSSSVTRNIFFTND